MLHDQKRMSSKQKDEEESQIFLLKAGFTVKTVWHETEARSLVTFEPKGQLSQERIEVES